ncbi:Keratin, type II cytoskeletal 8 [Myotis davidii]|uniref:Keratin, type II cytoskeletal 8 n=1 Tax=Myotis davidii TaxID=225400 RepID=L5LFB5_MYODS|nr:Keratin, type II cytoskeletal 8 [Myotis davidii]
MMSTRVTRRPPRGLHQPLMLEWARHQQRLFPGGQRLPAGLDANVSLAGGYGGAGNVGNFTAVQVNLLRPLKLEVDPNIQAVHHWDKEQIKTLSDKFASFEDKVRSREQQSKTLETQWSLLQQQTTRSTMANMFESYINKFQRQLDTLAQDQLRLEAEFGNMQGLVEDLKIKSEDEISKRTEMANEFVLIKKDVDGPGQFAQWLECQPMDRRVLGSIPSQGHVPLLQAPQSL